MAQQMKEVVEMDVDEETCQPKMKEKATEEKLDINMEKLETEFEIDDFDIRSFSLSELAKLAEGYEDDESEESVRMSWEEINNYMKQKMREYSRNPEINPLLPIKEEAKELLKVLKETQQKLQKEKEEYIEMLNNQIKFIERAGAKAETRDASAYVDFPILPEELPPIELIMGGEYIVDLPSCKVLRPSAKPSTASDSAFKKSTKTEELELIPESKIKVECIDISYDTPIKSTNDACIQPMHDAPAKSTYGAPTEATSSTRAKSSSIAPAMLTQGFRTTSNPGAPTKSIHFVHSKPTRQTPALSAYGAPTKLTRATPTKSYYNAPTMSTYRLHTEPTASTSANSDATGGAPEMKEPSGPLLVRPYNAHIITLPNMPPKPCLDICNGKGGIILQWNMPSNIPTHTFGKLQLFEIFAYQDQNGVPFNTKMWQKVGSVNAMDLPMACTLAEFKEGLKYYFTIRAMDIFNRFGSFSDPVSIIHSKTMV